MKLSTCTCLLFAAVYCAANIEPNKKDSSGPVVKSRKKRSFGIVAAIVVAGAIIGSWGRRRSPTTTTTRRRRSVSPPIRHWPPPRRRPPPPPRPRPPPPPIKCRTLTKPNNGKLSSSSRYLGSTVYVNCNRGYKLDRHSSLTCENEGWSHSVPRCVDEDECESGAHDCFSSARCVNDIGAFECVCDLGYDLIRYNNGKACVKRCPAGCVHGSCKMITELSGSAALKYESSGSVAPDYESSGSDVPEYECLCKSKWRGVSCDKAICAQGCSNGLCLKPDDCSCHPGWTGASCNMAICSRGCKNGACDSPEKCSCHKGWTGEICDKAVCENECVNGGVCSLPDTCDCKGTEWKGNTCSEPACQSACQNGGTCVAPSTCDCVVGYSGPQCEFKTCVDMAAPANGLVNCTIFNNQQVCNVSCNDAYDFGYEPNNPFVCRANGKWSYEERKDPVPECVEADILGIFLSFESEFEYPGDCESLSAEEKLKISNQIRQSLIERLCPCNEITIPNDGEVECVDGGGRSRRNTTTVSVFAVTFRVEASIHSRKILIAKYCNSTCRASVEKIVIALRAGAKKLVSSVKADPLSIEIREITLISKNVAASHLQASCGNPGQIQIGTRCIQCGKGNHIREGKCQPCPLHTYQDKAGQSKCISCPSDTETLWKGSKSSEKCLRVCSTGTYSHSGLHPCTPCPMNSYQPEAGQTSCLTCRNGTITLTEGAIHESMCVPNCTNSCRYGHRCDGCQCLSEFKVCDLTQDCMDGSDEKNCESCEAFVCSVDFLIDQRICTSSFAAVAEIKDVVKMKDDTTMMECEVKEVLYSDNSTNMTSVNDGHFYLGSKAVACDCPSVQAGHQYMLTGHKNQNGALIVSHDGIFKPWRNDTKREISEAISLVKSGNCSLNYGWDE